MSHRDKYLIPSSEQLFGLDPLAATLLVCDMREHHGLTIPDANPSHEFIMKCLEEEFDELEAAKTQWDTLDALIDLMTFAMGMIGAQCHYIYERMYHLFKKCNDELWPANNPEVLFKNLSDYAHYDNPVISFVSTLHIKHEQGPIVHYLECYEQKQDPKDLVMIIFACYLLLPVYKVHEQFKEGFFRVHTANLKKVRGNE